MLIRRGFHVQTLGQPSLHAFNHPAVPRMVERRYVLEPSLVIACAALAVSALVASWNVLAWVHSGARVAVGLRRGLLTYLGGLASGPFNTYDRWAELAEFRRDELHREVAIISVENRGRTAVTVFEPAMDLGLQWSKGRYRPFRRTMSPRLVTDYSDAVAESKIRLEPFDTATFIFDVGLILENLPDVLRHEREKTVHLRGSIRVAGKRWARRSSRRSAFRVRSGQLTLEADPSPRLVAYRALVRTRFDDDGVGFEYVTAQLVGDLVASGALVTHAALEEAMKNSPLSRSETSHIYIEARTVLRALKKHGFDVDDT